MCTNSSVISQPTPIVSPTMLFQMVFKSTISDTVSCYFVICVFCCRPMAKREADTYLTDQNWDKELPEEKVKDFVLFRNYLSEYML